MSFVTPIPTMRLEVRGCWSELRDNHVVVWAAWYRGQCRPFFQDGVCGEDVLGERLYVGPEGNGTCDCDEVSQGRSSSSLLYTSLHPRVG